jgi:hypothetical protein
MVEIHRFFRAGFAEGPALVGGVRAGDTDRAEAVAEQFASLSVSLHAHHEGEDQRLWTTLGDRAPSCAAHVERMKAQHATMLVQLDALDAAVPAWRASASVMDAQPMVAALGGINDALALHLPDEETNIVPVMETTMTQPEVEWFGEHGRKATPKGQMWNQLGAILAAQPDGGEEWSRKRLPAPVRLLWRIVGKRRYAAHRAELTGS